MGTFYANIVVKTPDAASIVVLVEQTRLPATVASHDGFVILSDQRLDEQDEDWMNEWTQRLSAVTGAPSLGVLVHDDDVLLMCLATGDGRVQLYNSCPDYFTGEGGGTPTGGDVELFASTFNPHVDRLALDKALNTGLADEKAADYPYVCEADRHLDLIHLLNLPAWSVSFAHASLDDTPPKGFDSAWTIYRSLD